MIFEFLKIKGSLEVRKPEIPTHTDTILSREKK